MSLHVLVLSEDPTLDQHILKPVIEKLFDDLGRRARVVVHEPPRGRSRGVDQARKQFPSTTDWGGFVLVGAGGRKF